ncbi:MAG TPA: type II toxin-antitoxin system VapC family toxin [Caulobacteraceae bacterium]|nr:type II toxin-antitoxin system VapC family toxin [Caulobacteraceae bacterium]
MRITADSNLLLRAIVRDDAAQSALARAELDRAEAVVVPVVALCEFAWVLKRVYRFTAAAVGEAITAILETENVATDRAAAAAGLSLLRAGADFADGVIAHQGEELGGEVFVSFDAAAVRRFRAAGVAARLPMADSG